MADKKIKAVMVRLEETDQATLLDLAVETGITAAALARMALQAVLKDYRVSKRITLPLRIRLDSDYNRSHAIDPLLNEPPPAELPRKKKTPPQAGPAGASAALPRSKPYPGSQSSAGA